MVIARIFGIIGLITIIVAILIRSKERKLRDILYLVAGVSLLVYSIALRDLIFIILQSVFTLVAIFDLARLTYFKGSRFPYFLNNKGK